MQTLDKTSSRQGVTVILGPCHLCTVVMEDNTFDATERETR
jgi:hypothetical protein